MTRELRDELEVPGHVIAIKAMTRVEIVAKIREILARYEAQGMTKLGQLPQSVKEELKQYFDALGLNHDDLNGGSS